jgi:hypothetical protein
VVAWTGYVGANRLGSADARQPLIAGALLLAFLGATLARPLLTLRTLDVAALVAAFAGAFLANAAWLEPGLALCFAATLYLAGRCAFGRSPPVRPELRGRLLEFALTGAVLLLGVVTLASDAAGDVGYASVAGATSILDGSLPYGQLDRIVLHGDTYGPLAYVSYLPGAVLYPVRDALSDGMGAMVVALLAALIAAYALYAAGRREAGREAGLRLALAWLCFPVTIVTASAGSNDLVVGASVAVALAAALRPGLATGAVAFGGLAKLAPLVLLPLWLARLRGPALRRGLAAAAGLTLAVLAGLLALGGADGVDAMFDAIGFQEERRSLRSPWVLFGIEPLQPAWQALVVTAAAAAAWWAWRGAPALPALAGTSAAVVLLASLAGNYWSPSYFAWSLPLVLAWLILPRPPAADSRPA